MLSRITLAAVAVVSMASLASAAQRPVFIGNGAHNPNQGMILTQDRPDDARPYTLTGTESARQHNAAYGSSIRVGNRVVAPAAQR
jgi:hypothetical protein